MHWLDVEPESTSICEILLKKTNKIWLILQNIYIILHHINIVSHCLTLSCNINLKIAKNFNICYSLEPNCVILNELMEGGERD
jgi:hypothetical protein